jgi:hypothetical protein
MTIIIIIIIIIYYYIFVNCNWVDTRWQWYSTHLHTNNTQNNRVNNKRIQITNKTTQTTNLEECWLCLVFASFTLAFALQLREKRRKTSVRVAEELFRIHNLTRQMLEQYLKFGHDASFHILPSSSITVHPTIQCY